VRVGDERRRCSFIVSCTHQGLHTITSSYDRERRVLTYYRLCERCGQRLGDVSRLDYMPRYEPGIGPAPQVATERI
jgi:hypothetical protein